MTSPAPVGRTAFLLGFAGLLPQAAAVCLLAFAEPGAFYPYLRADLGLVVSVVALSYAGVIASFLGGMWWGFAMRRTADHKFGQGAAQGRLAATAVLPSLVAWCVMLAGLIGIVPMPWALVAMGSALLLTLPVDRHLVAIGEAPANWMRLRVPLSVGLGALTTVAGLLLAR